MAGMGIFPMPFCELFQIHGSKSKLHPVRNLSQACVSGITHTMFLFCIRKDTLYCFFPCLIHPLVDRSISGIVCHFLVFLPDMPGNCLNTILTLCAKMPGRTVTTDLWITFIFPISVTVGGAVVQHLVLRAEDAVEILIIYILPPLMSALCLGTLVGCG